MSLLVLLPASCKALMALAAVITPSGDAFTLFMVALPLYMLYELSILMCKEKVEVEE